MATAASQPSPALFFDTVNAYQRTAAIKAAIELGIFTVIAEGAFSAAEIAKKVSAAERGVRILCDYLVIIGFLTKTQSKYALTPDTALFLTKNSPAYIGAAINFMLDPDHLDHFKDLTKTVRNGGAVSHGALEPESPRWVEFARSMAPLVSPSAHGIAAALRPHLGDGKPKKVLDIAAGHGMFGITLATTFPNVSVVALDWKNVLQVAAENAAKARLGARHSLLPGSAFDANFGAGYDVALVTNFLHHFNLATCEKLLKKVYAALNPGGIVAVLEFVPNEDRVSPPLPASFSLMMLGSTPEGDAYTYAELERMLKAAGFSHFGRHPMQAMPQEVVSARK